MCVFVCLCVYREHDKNPEVLFTVLYALHDDAVSFKLSVLGQTFTDVPPMFHCGVFSSYFTTSSSSLSWNKKVKIDPTIVLWSVTVYPSLYVVSLQVKLVINVKVDAITFLPSVL